MSKLLESLLSGLVGTSGLNGIGELLSPERRAVVLTKYREATRQTVLENLPKVNQVLLDKNRAVDFIEAGHINNLIKGWINEVGQWAIYNFGDNNGLGKIGPMLGAVEECGEFIEATEITAVDEPISEEQSAAMADAIADKWIFLFDFCSRSGVELVITQAQLIEEMVDGQAREAGLLDRQCHSCVNLKLLGKLAHANLKLTQRIRGIDPTEFRKRCSAILTELFLHDLEMTSYHLCGFIEKTWLKVKARNWRDNPTDAHKHEQAEPGNDTNTVLANTGDGEE